MKKKVLIALMGVFCLNASMNAQESFKVMFYNLLNFPYQTTPPNRINELQTILSDYQPDIFMVCELNHLEGANAILQMMQQNINPDYAMATFVDNTSDDNGSNQNDLQNLVFFNSSKFSIDTQAVITTTVRDFNHYKLKLNTDDQVLNPIFLDLIVCHLKSSSGTANQNERLIMVETLTNYLNTLTNPNNRYVLLGGDLNLYTSSEPAFQELIDADNTNNIDFVDPVNRMGSWHNNENYLDVFTQSTRTQTGSGGATGGFDDRFDFILTSSNLLDYTNNIALTYAANTYQAYGNNSNPNCYNKDINSTDCAEDGNATTIDFSENIRNALFNFSDHLPVTLELETNQNFLSIPEETFANIYEIIGTNISNNQLHLQTNNQQLTAKNLNIFNTLGQLVKTINIENKQNHFVDISALANGLYYIATPNMNIEPLKFIKTN